MVKESEYCANILYLWIWKEKWYLLELFQEVGDGWRRMVERVNSNKIYLIYCENFCKCHNVYYQHKNYKHTGIAGLWQGLPSVFVIWKSHIIYFTHEGKFC
jgi:hypothetical protein